MAQRLLAVFSTLTVVFTKSAYELSPAGAEAPSHQKELVATQDAASAARSSLVRRHKSTDASESINKERSKSASNLTHGDNACGAPTCSNCGAAGVPNAECAEKVDWIEEGFKCTPICNARRENVDGTIIEHRYLASTGFHTMDCECQPQAADATPRCHLKVNGQATSTFTCHEAQHCTAPTVAHGHCTEGGLINHQTQCNPVCDEGFHVSFTGMDRTIPPENLPNVQCPISDVDCEGGTHTLYCYDGDLFPGGFECLNATAFQNRHGIQPVGGGLGGAPGGASR